MDPREVIEATQRWVASVVIGLNLCPFARRPFEANKIRYVVSSASDEATLLRDLAAEVETLTGCSASEVETTLLIHPCVLDDFLDYNDFLAAADRLIDDRGQRGVLQVASFHPAYQFAGTGKDAAENYTNRSPYPMLHLLREESISAAAEGASDLEEIPDRNIALLRRLGKTRMREMLDRARYGAAETGGG